MDVAGVAALVLAVYSGQLLLWPLGAVPLAEVLVPLYGADTVSVAGHLVARRLDHYVFSMVTSQGIYTERGEVIPVGITYLWR